VSSGEIPADSYGRSGEVHAYTGALARYTGGFSPERRRRVFVTLFVLNTSPDYPSVDSTTGIHAVADASWGDRNIYGCLIMMTPRRGHIAAALQAGAAAARGGSARAGGGCMPHG